jgi:pSer/pThr/pTyr-binding forkhead associated (FHA) protein
VIIEENEMTLGNHNLPRDFLISARHATLKVDNNERILLRDLNSHFGTAKLIANKPLVVNIGTSSCEPQYRI